MNTFPRRLTVFLLLSTVAGSSVLLLAGSVHYKPYGVPDSLRPKWEALQLQIAATEVARKQAHAQPAAAHPVITASNPVAVTDEVEFDFGLLAPGISSSHAFTIRNEGQLPLVITAGETSCKCTVSKTSREVVEPGGQAEVTLSWNTGTSRDFYRQYAVIKTNDPQRREIEFGVTGRIKNELAFDVEQVVAKSVDPGAAAETSVVVFSQTMAGFEIVSAECDLAGFSYAEERVSAAETAALGATCARRMVITTAPLLDSGDIHRTLRVRVRPTTAAAGDPIAQAASGGEPHDRSGDVAGPAGDEDRGQVLVGEVPVMIQVAAPISFYAAGLHAEEGLNLGILSRGAEKVVRVIVRLRGEHPPATLQVTRVEPAFLQAAVAPRRNQPGTYTLTIRVPADAPPAIFNLQQQHGAVEVSDPRNPHHVNGFPIFGAVLAR